MEWRDVGVVKGVDFGGMYQVSSEGEVKSVARVVEKKDTKTEKLERVKSLREF